MNEKLNVNSYQSVINWLFLQLPMYQRQGVSAFKKDLKNVKAFCRALGDPQNAFKSIHIAGSNGKGSTAHIIAAGLSTKRLKVGLYTSPHYTDYRERVKINGTLMSKSFVKRFVKNHLDLIISIKPSFFEITVVMAFQYFKENEVDIAIIETGLGGRLDSTNIINPILSIITNISLDHVAMLGDTLDAIAGEKAGIIKNETPVIIGEHQVATDHVFITKSKLENAPLYFAQDYINVNTNSDNVLDPQYSYLFNEQVYKIRTDLLGQYQKYNIGTALYTLMYLSDNKLLTSFDYNITEENEFLNGLYESWKYMGRFQVLDTSPLVIADSAHNEAGISSVLKSINSIDHDQLHFVLGFVNDKTLEDILRYFPKGANYYYVNADIPRALKSAKLSSIGGSFGLEGKSYTSVRKGVAAAKKTSNTNDIIYIGGSIFVLAEVLDNY